MAFAHSAEYFLRRAERARENERERLREVANFYETLAAITPGFPPGYKLRVERRSTKWEARAEECRTMAEYLTDPLCRAQMLSVADTYDWMATSADKVRESTERLEMIAKSAQP